MGIKNFNEFNYIKEEFENFEDEENDPKWEVIINFRGGSYWEYKYDAIESIIELLDTNVPFNIVQLQPTQTLFPNIIFFSGFNIFPLLSLIL